MVLTSQVSSILGTIIQKNRGLVVINNKTISFYDYSKFDKNKINHNEINDLILFFHKKNEVIVRTYSLSDNDGDSDSWLIVVGKMEQTKEECSALSKLMRMAKINPDNHLISSIVGIPFEEKDESIVLSEKNISEIDNFIEEFGEEYRLESRQQVVDSIINEFTKEPIKYLTKKTQKPKTVIWRSKKGSEGIQMEFLDGVATCVYCNSKDCSHVEHVYAEKEMIDDLKKMGIRLNPKVFY